MTTPRYDERILSCLHKDATGSRPGSTFYENWARMTIEERNTLWDRLCADVEASIEDDRTVELGAIAKYEEMIAQNMELGASDRTTAIRWLVDSLDLQGQMAEPDGIAWSLGLPMEYAKEFRKEG